MKFTDEQELLEGKPVEETADEYNIKDYVHASVTTHQD